MDDKDSFRTAQRLHSLSELSLALGTSHDTDGLLDRIVNAAKALTGADGATLYRPADDGQALHYRMLINDTLGIRQGGVAGDAIDIGPIPLFDQHGGGNDASVAAFAANRRQSVNIADVYESDLFNFSGMREFDMRFGYRSKSMITIPVCNHDGELAAVLQLINAHDPATRTPRAFTPTDQHFVEALAAQAAVALTNQQLNMQLESLFEALVKMLNLCIDEKSPHTGRHCELVPQLAMMLAEATHATEEGPHAGFRMTEADRKELWMAALLHDCGKVVTPVHVFDKATKLETLFDRIHLVDTRFEVLKRDCEIRALRSKLVPGADIAQIEAEHQARVERLDDDQQFLRRANIGGEGMPPADQERVREIATRHRWTGPDGHERDLLDADEIVNLTVRFGTLTDAERAIINNHIVVTIRMLEALPWPRHLKNVPEYAGGHHERMDGKGYPRGLTGAQMSVQARLMAIADIFEALTARDRPYKTPKTLSESVHILGKFALNGHIDPGLFDIFIRKKVYLAFAHQYMDASQIDEVDEARIPGYCP